MMMEVFVFSVFCAMPAIFVWCVRNAFQQRGVLDPFPIAVIAFFALCSSLFLRCVIWTGAFHTGTLYLPCMQWPADAFAVLSILLDTVIVGATVLISLFVPRINIREVRKGGYHRGYAVVGFMTFAIALIHGWVSRGFLLFMPVKWEKPDDAKMAFWAAWFLGTCWVLRVVGGLARSLLRISFWGRETQRSLELLKGNIAPIIMLRSFKVDCKTVFGRTMDEAICTASVRSGIPIVSLCNPDEFLPTGGSLKIQSRDDNWKEIIRGLLRSSRAVIVCEGLTEGLRWEVQSFKKTVSPRRLFVVTPPFLFRMRTWFQSSVWAVPWHCLMNRGDIRQIFGFVWKKFATFLRSEGIDTGDVDPGSNVLIAFDDNWKAVSCETWRNGKLLFRSIIAKTKDNPESMCLKSELLRFISIHEVANGIDKVLLRRIHRVVMLMIGAIAVLTIALIVIIHTVLGVISTAVN